MAIRVAINGFGRIGRQFFRKAMLRDEVHIVAINDLADVENLAYLLQFDSVYGRLSSPVSVEKKDETTTLVAGAVRAQVFAEKEPGKLPWREMDIDVVVESTGFFTEYETSRPHLEAGAKRVVISAPVKDESPEDLQGATVLMGINDEKLQHSKISSNASCTTNAASPLIQILHESIGIEKALLNTVHGYTATQSLVDSPAKKDFRRGRAAAQNIIPSSTGAAKAVTKAVTDLENKFDGIAMRVPVIAGSIADITFLAKRDTSVEEVNTILRAAANDARWSSVYSATDEEIVSSDILGQPYAAIADLSFTRVVDGNLVKVLSWYDNEAGYVHALVEHVIASGTYAKK